MPVAFRGGLPAQAANPVTQLDSKDTFNIKWTGPRRLVPFLHDWTMPARRRIDTGMVGSPGKTYKEDSWDENKVVFDLKGEQRTGDVDNPEFYTLGASGMINAFIEGMELIDNEDGSLQGSADSNSVAGKIVFPNSGFGAPKWGEIFEKWGQAPMAHL
jgi:hypothetical protein